MRVKASQIVLFTALGIAVPMAFALPAKPPAHKAVPARVKANARESRLPAPRPKRGSVTKATASVRKPEKPQAQSKKPAPVVRQAEPPLASDPIQVTHDRKQHYSAEPGISGTEPRKATSADFLPSPKPVSTAQPPALHANPNPIVPALYDRRGRLVVPPALKGSHEILLRQNEVADQEGLDRIKDDADLDQMREDKLLVAIPAGPGLQTDERLPANRRYCRPWTAQFLTALARAHYARFHTALQVNSAVRTVEFQQKLLMTNGNAAPAEGETASPHLTGQAIDLAKHGLSLAEIAWLRGYLLPLVQAGKVDVEEEFQQACFHISVYRKYLPQPAPKREIAGTHRATGAAMATVIR